MYKGYKVIDADSHVLEPHDLWEKYIDKRYAAYAPKALPLIGGDPPRYQFGMKVGNYQLGRGPSTRNVPYIKDEQGKLRTYYEAYGKFVDLGFSPEAYHQYMDWRGLDYIVLYPTLNLFAVGVPGLDPKVAAAIRRAYNDWLYDFCSEGDERLLGVGSLDLRDVDLAIQEAERCVKELGFKSLYILPDPPIDGVPINHEYYDPLWAAIAELGVPIGIHEAGGHPLNPPGRAQVSGSGISYASVATTFGIGTMIAALVLLGGGVCDRHPGLEVVFLEATAGWAATWLWFLDELWEREEWGADHVTPHEPSFYFKRQCYISAEPEEPAIKYVIEYQGDDNIIYNTDFPHPREASIKNPADDFLALDGISEESRHKILWENAAKLYKLT